MMKYFLIVDFLLTILLNTAFAQSNREEWQPREKIMDSIDVVEGMKIGEIGAGKGYMTFHLAKKIGKKGKIYANEIDPMSLDYINNRIKNENIANIETVLGKVTDPVFPEKDLDMIIMVYVLHHLEQPVKFMTNVRKYLKDGGRLIIIERNTNTERTHSPEFMTSKQVLETMGDNEFELDRMETFLPKDTIYIFKIKGQ